MIKTIGRVFERNLKIWLKAGIQMNSAMTDPKSQLVGYLYYSQYRFAAVCEAQCNSDAHQSLNRNLVRLLRFDLPLRQNLLVKSVNS